MSHPYQAQPDPTAVMGRRVVAAIVDGLVIVVPASAAAAAQLDLQYLNKDELRVSSSTFCDNVMDSSTTSTCFDWGDRVYFSEQTPWVGTPTALLISILMLVLLQAFTGATLGKWLTGIRTVRENGEAPGLGRAIIRWLLLIVDTAPWCFPLVGFVAALTSKGHRRVGDMAAHTFVVRKAAMGQPIAVPGMTPAYPGYRGGGVPAGVGAAPPWGGPSGQGPAPRADRLGRRLGCAAQRPGPGATTRPPPTPGPPPRATRRPAASAPRPRRPAPWGSRRPRRSSCPADGAPARLAAAHRRDPGGARAVARRACGRPRSRSAGGRPRGPASDVDAPTQAVPSFSGDVDDPTQAVSSLPGEPEAPASPPPAPGGAPSGEFTVPFTPEPAPGSAVPPDVDLASEEGEPTQFHPGPLVGDAPEPTEAPVPPPAAGPDVAPDTEVEAPRDPEPPVWAEPPRPRIRSTCRRPDRPDPGGSGHRRARARGRPGDRRGAGGPVVRRRRRGRRRPVGPRRRADADARRHVVAPAGGPPPAGADEPDATIVDQPAPEPEADRTMVAPSPVAEAPVASAPATYNPQWDAARGTYIVWEPGRGKWLGWDDNAKEWRPL